MASGGVEVVGARKLRSTMKRAGQDLSDLKAVHSKVAAFVADKAAARAPRRTGRLAGTVRGNRAAASSRVMAGRQSVPYAKVIHWGWPARNISAQPWIQDTARDTETQWLLMFQAGIDAAIKRVEGA